MPRSTRRTEAIKTLFGLSNPGSAKGADAEGALSMASNVARVILHDIVGYARKSWRDLGPGVMAIRGDEDDAQWFSADDISGLIRQAESNKDHDGASALARLERLVENNDPDKTAILVCTRGGAFSVHLIPVDDPAGELTKVIERWNS